VGRIYLAPQLFVEVRLQLLQLAGVQGAKLRQLSPTHRVRFTRPYKTLVLQAF
jgi:hypothetical protein